ncbi:MAG: hypothetical protein DHS20C17_22710 [Cyclobacteriaceae bacterium]|nr:MAG: hypothetical protein DHS20C17_22710 [Cyclobacteriaceae bacterium]
MKTAILCTALLFGVLCAYGQKLVRYDLTVSDTTINYTGKMRKAIAVNGQIPMPTLYFTEGDTAEVYVHNNMHHETSVHWHGLLLPNEQDGVPYLTTAPIKPHSTHKYSFVIRQSGTYWYHSHTMLQEQIGMYGAIVIHKKDEEPKNEEVLILSDWSDENPHQIERSLHYATDWYMIKKNSVQSYGEALVSKKLKTKLENEFKRMHAMDVSDVYYERFLVNGEVRQIQDHYQAGDTVRLRVINGSSSTYFWLNYAGGKIRVVASDGMDVVPVEVDRLIVGVSEIYDVEVIIPDQGKSYEFTATSEDRIGFASYWLGGGEKVPATKMPPLNYFEGMQMMNDMMTIGGNMNDMGMNMSLQQMDMNAVMYREAFDTLTTLNYDMLKAPEKTSLPEVPFRELHFELTGNMNRYVWTINQRAVSETDKIRIKAGENVRIIITNNSMMRHPMHLHGHFFRVVNQHGEYSPLKNVVDIMPMETDTIEFHASEGYGDWYFHCHILYHMMAGMGRIFAYENSPPNPQLPNPVQALRKVYADDRRFYLGAEVGLESNGSDGEISLMNTRWHFSTEWRLGFSDESGYETESHFGRYLDKNQFLMVYTGWDWRYRKGHSNEENIFGQTSTKNDRGVAHFGIQYTMPWFIEADASIDHTGYFRLQISREDIAITKRLRLWGMWNTDLEYAAGARYIVTKYISASTHYDSDMGYGIGLTMTY